MESSKIECAIEELDPKSLNLLKTNARYMTHEQFAALVSNIKRDGQLTSTPLVARQPEGLVVVSGNHRVKAAMEAGLSKIFCLVTKETLSQDRLIALQLAHNAIVVQDDAEVLRQLYNTILDVDLEMYSGLDDKTLGQLAETKPLSIAEANLDFETMTLVFLPTELEAAQKAFATAAKVVRDNRAWFARFEDYDTWLDTLRQVSQGTGVANVATCVSVILRHFEMTASQLTENWFAERKGKKVECERVFGTAKIDDAAAQKIRGAIQARFGKSKHTTEDVWAWVAEKLAGQVSAAGEHQGAN